MYQALYRKWRPKTFSEVIGQDHITSTLQKQVADGHTGHAYLFTGTRGTGKTTVARILAKAINCENPVNGAPCCQCNACLGIDNGSVLDVTELDAASNNGVEQVRALREEAIYAPNVLKKRVYIIDEVHMLSQAAFNALLKILEEPPEHLVFILATTELHKVLPTILSRCQRFSFKRILPKDMEQQLLMIAEAEQIDLTADGAEIIARLANGALRDALSLLDQCRSIEGTLDSQSILDVLGLAGSVQTMEMMGYILKDDTQSSIELFHKLYQNGKDVTSFLSELSDLARDFVIMKAAPKGGDALLSGLYSRSSLQQMGETIPMERFIHIASLLQEYCSSMSSSLRPRTDAELCLLRLCNDSLCNDDLALASRVSKLEEAIKNGVAPISVRNSAPQSAETTKVSVKEDRTLPATADVKKEDSEKRPVPVSVSKPEKNAADSSKGSVDTAVSSRAVASKTTGSVNTNIWAKLMNFYCAELPVNLRPFLQMAKGVVDGSVLRVYCPNDFVKTTIDTDKVTDVLKKLTDKETGSSLRIEFVTGDAPATKAATSAGSAEIDPLDSLIERGRNLENFKVQ